MLLIYELKSFCLTQDRINYEGDRGVLVFCSVSDSAVCSSVSLPACSSWGRSWRRLGSTGRPLLSGVSGFSSPGGEGGWFPVPSPSDSPLDPVGETLLFSLFFFFFLLFFFLLLFLERLWRCVAGLLSEGFFSCLSTVFGLPVRLLLLFSPSGPCRLGDPFVATPSLLTDWARSLLRLPLPLPRLHLSLL